MTGRFFSRWYTTPHRENPPRSQCVPCAGGGEINGTECPECDGRGWFDADNPPARPKAKTTTRKAAITR